ncbi:MAG: FAD-dependent oxidoreductase, partial [Leptolyngbyaceae cyanobacterium MO_188.B28]|nr:FAD-dependent oxidoreductase [Leptolyngbyaceae cyanobacterium MO_188.B28]
MPKRRRNSRSARSKKRPQRVTRLSIVSIFWLASLALLLNAFKTASSYFANPTALSRGPVSHPLKRSGLGSTVSQMAAANGRPQLSPLPYVDEVWECEVIVIGGSLGGISAASQSMNAGAKTCLIELTPWLGGQVSSQGVSALDESRTMRRAGNFSPTWQSFKQLIRSQSVKLPSWTNLPKSMPVWRLNSCWVGELCFAPRAGAKSAEQWLQASAVKAPGSRWATSTAFKGATFTSSGDEISAIYAVKRTPRSADYAPRGRLSRELHRWYNWSSDEVFQKTPLRLQAPAGKRLMVIDATDTGELIGWANIPHRLGSESQAQTGEISAPEKGNPACTQAFTFPFVLAIHDDGGRSWDALKKIQPGYARHEHRREFSLEGFPMFHGGSFFNYRRMVSTQMNSAHTGWPALGDMTLVNWNLGNDWTWMNPPLILDEASIDAEGQRQNW